jgi:broad specificity phosphatase PhoE
MRLSRVMTAEQGHTRRRRVESDSNPDLQLPTTNNLGLCGGFDGELTPNGIQQAKLTAGDLTDFGTVRKSL